MKRNNAEQMVRFNPDFFIIVSFNDEGMAGQDNSIVWGAGRIKVNILNYGSELFYGCLRNAGNVIDGASHKQSHAFSV
jgi:hypothetical protein